MKNCFANIFAFLLSLSVITVTSAQNDDYNLDEIEIDTSGEEALAFFMVEEQAKFIGGESAMFDFISQNITMPDSVVDCRVLVEFIVERDSTVSSVHVRNTSKGILPTSHQKAAVDVVNKSSKKWVPAKQREHFVRQRLMLPIKFQAE